MKDPASRIAILYPTGEYWLSMSTDTELSEIDLEWIKNERDLSEVILYNRIVKKQML